MTARCRGPVLAKADGAELIDCERCGWAHVDPMPDPAEVGDLYREAYYEDHYPGFLEKDLRERDYWNLEHDWKLDRIAEVIGGPGRILDAGCSVGLFVGRARERGWDAVGVEPSRTAAELAETIGVGVRIGRLEDALADGAGSYDAVHSKLVLEHVHDPLAFLEVGRELVRPGGAICIQVPNERNALQQAAEPIVGRGPWWFAPKFHLNYFTFDSIERLLIRAGFTPVVRLATFPMEWFLLAGDLYVGNDEVGAQAHARRMTFERHMADAGLDELRRSMYEDLALRDLGREAIVIARRPEGDQ